MPTVTYMVAKAPSSRRRFVHEGASSLEYAFVGFLLLILVSLISMGLLRARESARDQLCLRRLVLLATAVNDFEAIEGGYPGFVNPGKSPEDQPTSWVAATLPYLDERLPPIESSDDGWRILEERPDGEELAPKRPWKDWKKAQQQAISQLICPNEVTAKIGEPGATSYVASCGYPDAPEGFDRPDYAANGLFLDLRSLPSITQRAVQDLDGTEYTLMLSENVQAGNWDSLKESEIGFVWSERLAGVEISAEFKVPEVLALNQAWKGTPNGYKTARPSSHHVGGVHAVFANTRLSKIASNIDPIVYIRMCGVNDAALMNPWTKKSIGPPVGRDETR